MAIDLTIKGLKEAKADLERLNQEFEKVKNDPINSKKIAKEFNNLSKEIDETTEELLKMKSAGKLVNETFDDINETLLGVSDGAVLPLSTQIGEMEDRMYQLAAAGEVNSDEFKSLQKEAARLRGVIIETDRSVDLLAENGGLQIFATGWGQVGERLMSLDFQGAATDAQQLQASVGNLGSIGKDALTGLAKTVGTLSKTFVKFGVSLLANPIFLIAAVITAVVGAVALLLNKLGVLKPILDAIGDAFDYLIGFVNDAVQAFKDLTDWLGLTSFASDELAEKQIENAKKTKEALSEQQQKQIEGLDREIKLKQASGEATTQIEIEKQKIVKQTAYDTLQALNQEMIARRQLGDVTKEELDEFKKSIAEQKKIILDSSTEIKSIEIKTQKEIEANEKESLERRRAEYKEFAKAREAAARLIQDLELSLKKDGLEKELEINKVNFERIKEDLAKNAELTANEKKRLNELYTLQELQAERDIRNKFQEELKLDVIGLDEEDAEQRKKKLDEEVAFQAEMKAIKDKALEEQRQRAEQELADRIAITEMTLGSINALTEGSFAIADRLGKQDEKSKEKRAKRQFQINKSMQLAGAVMDGYKAVTASLSQSPVAIGVLPNPVGIASLAFAVSTSLANIAKIASTQFQTSGGSPSSGGGGGNVSSGGGSNVQTSAPSINLFGNSRDFNNVQDQGSAETSTQVINVNATVSEAEISGTQEKVNKFKQNAEL